MYCGECGTKNKLGSIFCGECGNKLTPIKKEPKVRKKMSKKTKIMIGIIIFVAAFLSATIAFFCYETSSVTIARKYIEAITKKDANTLYQYLEIEGDNTFITKQIYQELIKDNPDYDIENYYVSDVTYGKLTARVTFIYTEKNRATEKLLVVTLIKQKNNKWLFFPNWKITSSEIEDQIVEDFKINVPKNATVTYAGIKVKDSYYNEDLSTDTADVYVLTQVFSSPTKIKVELENGYMIEDTVTPSFYKSSYTAKVSLNTISKEEQEKIVTLMKSDLNALYNGAINGKKLTEIENLSFEKEEIEALEQDYNELVKDLKNSSNTLTSIEFTNITLSSVSLDEKGNLEFRLKANYKYSVRYTDSSKKEQTKNSKGYSYMKLSYNVKNQTYYIVDANDLEDYFSRN